MIDREGFLQYSLFMAKITYNTRVEEDLIKRFKILAILESKRQNQLLEEAIQDLLKKYAKKDPQRSLFERLSQNE